MNVDDKATENKNNQHQPGSIRGTAASGKVEELNNQLSRLESDLEEFSVAISRLAKAGVFSTRPLSAVFPFAEVRDGRHEMTTTTTTSVNASSVTGEQEQPDVQSRTIPMWSAFALLAVTVLVLIQRLMRPRKQQSGRHDSGEACDGDTGAQRCCPPPCDVAFLCHPPTILSTFALWLPERRPLSRWRCEWWMVPAWPICLVASLWAYVSPTLVGFRPYVFSDRFKYIGTIVNEVWIFRAFGYHYMMKNLRGRIARGIEATVREADKNGVSVLGLGALNKAEFINHGGQDILDAFTPKKTRIVHGNTLTAAVVVENVKHATAAVDAAVGSDYYNDDVTAAGKTRRVFLTGATSKVGRPVALKLALDGYDVVCCTSSDERFEFLRKEFKTLCSSDETQSCTKLDIDIKGLPAKRGGKIKGSGAGTAAGRLLRARRVDEGVHHRFWVIGKFDTSVRQHIPLGASAIVFAVPCPLQGHRPDVSVVTGGILQMDTSLCSPRRFHILLPFDQLYACHAAAIVHHRMGWRHHEVGKVDVAMMEPTLRAARDCGFNILSCPPRPCRPSRAQGFPREEEAFISRFGAGMGRWREILAEQAELLSGAAGATAGEGATIPDGSVSTRGDVDVESPGSEVELTAHHLDAGRSSEAMMTTTMTTKTTATASIMSDEIKSGDVIQSSSPGLLPILPDFCRVVVVGSGASGLSAAACLRSRGEESVLVLERSDTIGGAWEHQYEGLHITTRRVHCGLPGWPIPLDSFTLTRSSKEGDAGLVTAGGFSRYLRAYRRRFDLSVVKNAEVFQAYREAGGNQGVGAVAPDAIRSGKILVRFCLMRKIRAIRCEHLVVATGKNALPKMPPSVFHSLRGFSGEVLHSSKVRGLEERAMASGKICIVGMGNSACDLAVALLLNGAAGRIHISTRSAPPIVMRQWGSFSIEWISRAAQMVPVRVKDWVLHVFAEAKWGRGWRSRVFPPEVVGRAWSACAANRIPCIDKGHLVEALLDGRIVVHGPIESCEGHSLRFRHSKDSVDSVSTVILATGFDPVHEMWLSPDLQSEGHRGGVHMVGFTNGRALLPLRQIGTEARRTAARIVPRFPPGPK